MISNKLWGPALMRLRARRDVQYTSYDRGVLATGADGFLADRPEQGLFIRETRVLSAFRYLIDGKMPHPVALSNVTQDRWLGYYLAHGAHRATALQDTAQQAIELRLTRRLEANGMREEIAISNFTQRPRRLTLTLHLAADFADLTETGGPRKQKGRKRTIWQKGKGKCRLEFRYSARHRYAHQDERGTAHGWNIMWREALPAHDRVWQHALGDTRRLHSQRECGSD